MVSWPSSHRIRYRGDGSEPRTSWITPTRSGRSVDSDSAATRSPTFSFISHLPVLRLGRSVLQPRHVPAAANRAIRLGVLAAFGLELGGPLAGGLAGVGADELLGELARLLVGALRVRGLHQIARGAIELPADPVVERQLHDPHRVDHDPGRVGRIPHLELELDVQRHVTERAALEADVGPLA